MAPAPEIKQGRSLERDENSWHHTKNVEREREEEEERGTFQFSPQFSLCVHFANELLSISDRVRSTA